MVASEGIHHYNNTRLHSSIGYITPKDRMAGRQNEIHDDRDRKLEAARALRAQRRQFARAGAQHPSENPRQHLADSLCA